MKIQGTNYPLPTTPAPRPASKPDTSANAAGVNSDSVKIDGKTDKQVTYSPPNKLSAEQLRAIKESLSAQQQSLLQAMSGNTTNQANEWLKSVGGVQSELPTNNQLAKLGLPALATTQEGALAAISEGGAYSVNSVATRIFDMAKSMAGDDPEMLEKMKAAVKKGFKAAGVDFERATGKKLPDISMQTYDEVMKRFEAYEKELGEKVQ